MTRTLCALYVALILIGALVVHTECAPYVPTDTPLLLLWPLSEPTRVKPFEMAKVHSFCLVNSTLAALYHPSPLLPLTSILTTVYLARFCPCPLLSVNKCRSTVGKGQCPVSSQWMQCIYKLNLPYSTGKSLWECALAEVGRWFDAMTIFEVFDCPPCSDHQTSLNCRDYSKNSMDVCVETNSASVGRVDAADYLGLLCPHLLYFH